MKLEPKKPDAPAGYYEGWQLAVLCVRVPALLWEADADRYQSNESQLAGNRASVVRMRTE